MFSCRKIFCRFRMVNKHELSELVNLYFHGIAIQLTVHIFSIFSEDRHVHIHGGRVCERLKNLGGTEDLYFFLFPLPQGFTLAHLKYSQQVYSQHSTNGLDSLGLCFLGLLVLPSTTPVADLGEGPAPWAPLILG